MEEDIPRNEVVVLEDLLDEYLHENPDDVLKVIEFFSSKKRLDVLNDRTRNLFLAVGANGEIRPVPEFTPQPIDQVFLNTPLTVGLMRRIRNGDIERGNYTNGICGICKEAIGTYYTMTMPCGHTYHSDCCLAYDFEHGMVCLAADCTDRDVHAKAKRAYRAIRTIRNSATNTALRHLRRDKAFKKDIQSLRRVSSRITSTEKKLNKLVNEEKNKVCEQHADYLNMIQRDINAIRNKAYESDTYTEHGRAVREGRKLMRLIHNKYHTTLHDLENIGIHFSWNIRWILERHRNYRVYSGYRAGLRIRPGRTATWRPSAQKKRTVVDVPTDSDSDVET